MIGDIVQFVLYGLVLATAYAITAGVLVTYFVRKGRTIDVVPVLAGLSLIASAAPYIGLFGTVWHIIQAMGGIGGGNLNVAAIAKPIGEALYATLWGLGCAIPALIAHRGIQIFLPNESPEEALLAAPNATPAQEG